MKIKALFLKKVYNISNRVNDDIYMYLETNKIIFQSVMEGKAVLLEIIHITECPASDKPIVFDITKLRNLISVLNDDDLIDISRKDNYISLKVKNFHRKLILVEPVNLRFILPDERKDKPIVFTHDIDVFISNFKNAIKASDDIKSELNLLFNKNSFIIMKKTELEESKCEIKGENLTVNKSPNDIDCLFNESYINDFLDSTDGKINIKVLKNGPIKFVSKPIKDLTIKYMVAPLIKPEESTNAE